MNPPSDGGRSDTLYSRTSLFTVTSKLKYNFSEVSLTNMTSSGGGEKRGHHTRISAPRGLIASMGLATHHAGLEPVEAEIDRGADQRHAGAQRELHRQRQPAERVGTLGEVPG